MTWLAYSKQKIKDMSSLAVNNKPVPLDVVGAVELLDKFVFILYSDVSYTNMGSKYYRIITYKTNPRNPNDHHITNIDITHLQNLMPFCRVILTEQKLVIIAFFEDEYFNIIKHHNIFNNAVTNMNETQKKAFILWKKRAIQLGVSKAIVESIYGKETYDPLMPACFYDNEYRHSCAFLSYVYLIVRKKELDDENIKMHVNELISFIKL